MSFILYAKNDLSISIYMHKSAFIYNYGITDGMTKFLCLCVLLVAIGMVCYWLTVYCLWCASMWILYNYRYICVTAWCPTISPHPPYNIVRHIFCITMKCLSDDLVSLHVYTCCCFVSVFNIRYLCLKNCTATVMYCILYLG